MDERIIAAVIGAVVVAFGWIISFRLDRERYRSNRQEKEIDIQKALRAEIKAIVDAPQNQNLESSLERGLARFETETEADPYVPFIPHEKHDTVFQALVGDIHVLPTETVEPVILYYNQTVSISMMASDLRSDRFAKLDRDRRRKMLRDYMTIKIEGQRLGRIAIDALSEYIDGKTSDGAGVNKTDQDPSAPEQGV